MWLLWRWWLCYFLCWAAGWVWDHWPTAGPGQWWSLDHPQPSPSSLPGWSLTMEKGPEKRRHLVIKACMRSILIYLWPAPLILSYVGQTQQIQFYLYRRGAHILSWQNPACLQTGNIGVLHLQEVPHQPGHIHLPIRAQEEGLWLPRVWLLCHKVCEDSHQSMLKLQHASPALTLFLAAPAWFAVRDVQMLLTTGF